MLKKVEYVELKKLLIEEVGKEMFEVGDRFELKKIVRENIRNGMSKFNDKYKEYVYKDGRFEWDYVYKDRRFEWDVVDFDRFYRLLERLRNI